MKDPHLEELGQFLRARRAGIDPTSLGWSSGPAHGRRVTGLRREEVAAHVSISHDYYSRIEQGRLAPSEPVLAAIADLYGLDQGEREYVEDLASRAERRTPPQPRTATVRPQLQRLLDQFTTTPAFILGKYLDVLAYNPLAGALMGDLDRIAPDQRNVLRLGFTDTRYQAIYPDWRVPAREGIAVLRRRAAANPHDPKLAALVGELSLASPDFARWWADHNVVRPTYGRKTIRHPELGDFEVDWDAFEYAADPDQQLTVWSAEPGSPTHDKLRILASWTAPTSTRAEHRLDR